MAGLAAPVLIPAGVAQANVFGDACESQPNSPICKQTDPANAETNTSNFIQDVIGILLFALGTICVIVIIIAGIRYATADGDSGKVSQAKNVILYAVVGLIVALLAYAIVNFVLERFA